MEKELKKIKKFVLSLDYATKKNFWDGINNIFIIFDKKCVIYNWKLKKNVIWKDE